MAHKAVSPGVQALVDGRPRDNRQQDNDPGLDDGIANAACPGAFGATVLKSIMFLQEAGDTAAISVNDLHQGQLGDCFLISSIGELALTHPDAISRMIKVNANGTETVTLYVGTSGRVAGYGATAFKATTVTIDNSFSRAGVNNQSSQNVLNGQKEIWPQVLEKAIALLDGGYGAVANGGNPMIVMQQITGHVATFMSPTQLTLQRLQAFVAEGDLIAMDTGIGKLGFNLVNNHAYMFEKVTITGGVAMVQVGNPWGFNQASMIPFAQLSRAFVEIDIGHFT